MIGQTLGHYRILEQIGAGGMGVVYRAHDERLDRDVACKMLPAGLLSDESARKRFQKEARALAKMNHPNIASIFDFDVQGDVRFLVMEYIPGITLNDKLLHQALPEKEIVRLGVQLAEGLAAAHAEGIIHRDLKPGNLRITPDGRMKILDFGLAKLVRPLAEAEATASMTEAHVAVGTFAYMAPEQLTGSPVDARTDIYALGNVLYEMATGQRPFATAKTSLALSNSILHEAPVVPRLRNAGLSAELERIILKCLEKDPENRYQTAKEITVDLRHAGMSGMSVSTDAVRPPRRKLAIWSSAAAALVLLFLLVAAFDVGGLKQRLFSRTPGEIRSIAVLPLENLSRDPEQEYFADGMTESLIAELSRIRALKVTSRTSVMQFKRAKKPLPEIARALNVDAVIEGSVLRENNEVRITVQLIRAASDAHLWAESYVRELKSILSLQGEVAQAIAKQVRATVTPDETARLSHRQDVDPEAHTLVLRGEQLLAQSGTTPEGIEQAIGLFQKATERDPQSALAYAGLSGALIAKIGGPGLGSPGEVVPLALNAAERAIQLNPDLGEVFAARAIVRQVGEWDWKGAEKDYVKALELSPNSARILEGRAELLLTLNRIEESVELGHRAVELDPLNIGLPIRQGYRLLRAGRGDDALHTIRNVLLLKPDDVFAKWMLGVILSERKQYDEAISVFLSRKVPTANTNWALGYTYAYSGKKEDARRIIAFLEKRRKEDKTRYVSPCIIGHIYAALGEKDKAFEYHELGFRERDYWLGSLQVDPRFDPLRSDPRFQDLLRRMNFPPPDSRTR